VTELLEHVTRVSLRWRDMDMLGHLNQSVYHELLEEARAGLITELVKRVEVGGDGVLHGTFVLARVELDYRTEVRRDHGAVDISVRVAKVGRSSITLEHEVLLPDRTVAAAGLTILVGWDPVARGKRVLSDAERAALGVRPALSG
jgi:acyl-CoA thioester hydrolase